VAGEQVAGAGQKGVWHLAGAQYNTATAEDLSEGRNLGEA